MAHARMIALAFQNAPRDTKPPFNDNRLRVNVLLASGQVIRGAKIRVNHLGDSCIEVFEVDQTTKGFLATSTFIAYESIDVIHLSLAED